ncbi:MAG TPA: cation:proton antiporter [Methylocella sp.]|nr:cation:proton antiporter [Methylocella sp.]
MTSIWAIASLWLGLALLAGVLSIWFRVSAAMTEIVVGMFAQLVFSTIFGSGVLDTGETWVKVLSGVGVMLLTFLAGAELDPHVMKLKWKEALAVGSVSFLAPFLTCTAVTHYLLGWNMTQSWLAGVALAGTSVAIVYAEMMLHNLNNTDFGKILLGACFVTDFATVLALGLIFSPFTIKTSVFVAITAVSCVALPWLTPRIFKRFGERPSELETKFLLVCLLGLGALATWADSEAVLPAYLIGMMLAGTVGKDHALIRRLRTLTFGFVTPFFFVRAGYLVSIPAVVAAPVAFLVFMVAKISAKTASVYAAAKFHDYVHREAMYSALLMSSGLAFGAIVSLFGLTHGLIDKSQYSALVAAVIGTGILPTLIANNFFVPHHLCPKAKTEDSGRPKAKDHPAIHELFPQLRLEDGSA